LIPLQLVAAVHAGRRRLRPQRPATTREQSQAAAVL